jgi:hypothetical protein
MKERFFKTAIITAKKKLQAWRSESNQNMPLVCETKQIKDDDEKI